MYLYYIILSNYYDCKSLEHMQLESTESMNLLDICEKILSCGVVFFGVMLNICGKCLVYFIDVREIYIIGVDFNI